MVRIAFELNCLTAAVGDAISDAANAFRKGYGAGTLTNPRKGEHDSLDDEDYLGFWTSAPDSWGKGDTIHLLITLPDADDNALHDVAAAMEMVARRFDQCDDDGADYPETGDVIVFGHKVGTWAFNKA